MKILLINHYAGSDRMGMEYRPFYLAREWAAEGHAVTILGASFSHLRSLQPEVRADLDTTEEEGVRFRWLRTGSYAGNGAGRVANMAAFVAKLFAYADRIAREERPDVVICSSTYPLDIYPGARIAARTGARLVFEVHDLWPLTPMLLGGYSPYHPYIMLLQHAEDWAYSHADVVVSIPPHTLEHMVGRGMDPAKFAHIPNGIPAAHMQQASAVELPAAAAAAVERERARGRFLVGYTGGMNPSNAVSALLEAARLLSGEKISFILAGNGSQAAALKEQAAQYGLDNFHMVGAIPKPTVQAFLKELDVGVMPWFSSPLHRFGVSHNKMFDYMLASRPVVQANDLADNLATEAQCGIAVPPDDPAALAQAVLSLSRMPLSQRQILGANGRRFVLQHHDYRCLAARFLQAIHPARKVGSVVGEVTELAV